MNRSINQGGKKTMKKVILFVFLCVITPTVLLADFPYFEFFGSSLRNTYGEMWTLTGTLESVPNGTDSIPNPPGGDGYFGKLSAVFATANTCGKLLGTDTDTNYTIKAKIYIPVVNVPDGTTGDDYWYQSIVFYYTGYGEYGRFHTHFNLTPLGSAPPLSPRIRLQVVTGSAFVYTLGWAGTTDFTVPASSSWHELKMVLSGTTALCYFDGTQLPGTADWTSTAASRTAGRFGFGEYFDDAGSPLFYIDQFKAWTSPSEPPDPIPTATPTPTPIPMSVKIWSHYE